MITLMSFSITCLIIALLIFLSALFSASETALTTLSLPRLKGSSRRVTLIETLRGHMSRLIGAILLSNNLVNIAATSLATNLCIHIFGEEMGIGLATLIMTVTVLIFAELMPKIYAIHYPEYFALKIAPFLSTVVRLCSPLTKLVQTVSESIWRLFGVTLKKKEWTANREELRLTIDHYSQKGLKREGEMLRGVLDLSRIRVEEIMIHRTDVEMLNADDSIDTIVRHVLESPYTRFPVYKGKEDNIIGVLHTKNILPALWKKQALHLQELITPPWFIPETTPIDHQMHTFKKKRHHLALVVDEYGVFQGIVTLEDILEEIVGDISDEHDTSFPGIRKERSGSYLVDGNMPIRDLNRHLRWRIPSTHASTLGGLLITASQRIPANGHMFNFYGYVFEVVRQHKQHIDLIRIWGR